MGLSRRYCTLTSWPWPPRLLRRPRRVGATAVATATTVIIALPPLRPPVLRNCSVSTCWICCPTCPTWPPPLTTADRGHPRVKVRATVKLVPTGSLELAVPTIFHSKQQQTKNQPNNHTTTHTNTQTITQ